MPGRLEVPLLILLIFVVLFAGHVGTARAAPVMQATAADVSVVLHDEPCKLEAMSGGQYLRAQWIAPTGAVEGCWGVVPISEQHRILVFYFADRTMAAMPPGLFVRVSTL